MMRDGPGLLFFSEVISRGLRLMRCSSVLLKQRNQPKWRRFGEVGRFSIFEHGHAFEGKIHLVFPAPFEPAKATITGPLSSGKITLSLSCPPGTAG